MGLSPNHIQEIPLNEFTQEQFLVLLTETAKKLKWEITHISDTGLIAYTDTRLFAWNAEVKIRIVNGIANIQSESTGSGLVDRGRNKTNVVNFISSLDNLKQLLSKEDLDTKYQELKGSLVSPEEDVLKLPPRTIGDEIKDIFFIFKPAKGFFITPILIDLNILIFILMVISGVHFLSPDSLSLLQWGGNLRSSTLGGEWWRLITCCFLHIGIFHLLMNMYALFVIGLLLEPRLGRTRFITAYLLTGIAASLTSLAWHDFTVSAGASGAIFGMYGVFLAMLTTDLIEKSARKTLLASVVIFVGYNLIYGLKGGIDNAAHIGGLASGFIIGYAMIPSLKRPDENKLKFGTLTLLAILTLASSFIVFRQTPNDIGVYEEKLQEFSSIESIALGVYNFPENTPDDTLLHEIAYKGIPTWNQGIALLDTFEKMNLPLEIRMRNTLLREYIELRVKSYELLYKAISQNSNDYDEEIENYNKQIQAKINELNGAE